MWKYSMPNLRPCEQIRVGDIILTYMNSECTVYDIYIGRINDVCTYPTHPTINHYHPNYFAMCNSCKYLNPNAQCTILQGVTINNVEDSI